MAEAQESLALSWFHHTESGPWVVHAKLRASETPAAGHLKAVPAEKVILTWLCGVLFLHPGQGMSYLTCPSARVASQATVKSDQVSPVKLEEKWQGSTRPHQPQPLSPRLWC